MSEVLLLKNKAFIDLLLKTKSFEQRQALLDTATPSHIRAISELCLDLLHERGGLIEAGPERDQLVNHQELVRKLATEQRSFARKRNLLANAHQREVTGSQIGRGFSSFLLTVLGNLFTRLVGEPSKQ